MLDLNRIEAQRVRRERRVAAGPVPDLPIAPERHFPNRAAGRVGDEQLAFRVEGHAVRDEILSTERVRERARREIARLTADAVGDRGHGPAKRGAIAHRLDAEHLEHHTRG